MAILLGSPGPGATGFRILRWLVALVLFFLISWSMYRSYSLLVSAKSTTAPENSNMLAEIPAPDSAADEAMADINAAKLFGTKDQPNAAPRPTQNTKTQPPTPPVPLTLWGLLVIGNEPPLAIISARGGPQKVYREGSKVEADVHIRQINAEGVLVENKGTEEVIRLPKGGSGRQPSGPGQHSRPAPPTSPFGRSGRSSGLISPFPGWNLSQSTHRNT